MTDPAMIEFFDRKMVLRPYGCLIGFVIRVNDNTKHSSIYSIREFMPHHLPRVTIFRKRVTYMIDI